MIRSPYFFSSIVECTRAKLNISYPAVADHFDNDEPEPVLYSEHYSVTDHLDQPQAAHVSNEIDDFREMTEEYESGWWIWAIMTIVMAAVVSAMLGLVMTALSMLLCWLLLSVVGCVAWYCLTPFIGD